ncbi:MAG: hypothetical protein JWP13_754 [Candidatus Saccharibacteria bacterium]|nr:hypothetical protein [Candidatus Saccharibacteria bacterium]
MSVAEQAPQSSLDPNTYGRHAATIDPHLVVVKSFETPVETIDVTVRETTAEDSILALDPVNRSADLAEEAGISPASNENDVNRVERGKEAARLVGNSVITATQTAGTKLSETFSAVTEASKKGINSFRNFLKARSESARARKDTLLTTVKNRSEKVTGGTARKYETSKNGVNRAGRVGKEALKFSGLAVLGTGAIATEVAAKGVRYGVDKVAHGTEKTMDYGRTKVIASKEYAMETVGLMHENVVDIRAGVQKHSAQRAGKKANKAMLKEAHRMNRQFDTEQRLKAMRGESE